MEPVVNTVTISSKGQVVIPAAIRRRMKLKKNDTMIVSEEGQRIVLKPVVKLSELMGIDKGKFKDASGELMRMRAEDERLWIKRINGFKKGNG